MLELDHYQPHCVAESLMLRLVPIAVSRFSLSSRYSLLALLGHLSFIACSQRGGPPRHDAC
jgi:hypothetical protein